MITFKAGTKAVAEEVNSNFNEVIDLVNTNQEAANNNIETTNANLKTDIESQLDNKLSLDDFFFQPGETYTVGGGCCIGYLTSSKTSVRFFPIMPKRLDKVTSVTVNTIKTNIRPADGGYIPNSSMTDGGEDLTKWGTVSASIENQNTVRITLVLTTASSYTNNIPLAAYIEELSLTFS